MSNLILRGMNMKKYALATAMVVLLAAGYSQRSDAAACPGTIATPAPIASYEAVGFTCDIGDKTFSLFSFVFTPGADTNMTVVPQTGPFFGFDFFTPNLVSNSTTAADIKIAYTVTCIAVGVNCIDSAELTITGSESGTGGGSVGETVCLNHASTALCPLADTLAFNTALVPPGPLSASATFAPVHVLAISKDANALGGTAGNATISGILNTVDQPSIPEPTSLALLGAGLAGLAALRRRKTLR